jgi:hypothetical protein
VADSAPSGFGAQPMTTGPLHTGYHITVHEDPNTAHPTPLFKRWATIRNRGGKWVIGNAHQGWQFASDYQEDGTPTTGATPFQALVPENAAIAADGRDFTAVALAPWRSSGRRRPHNGGQPVIVNGTPAPMRRASHVMARVLSRTQPWDTAVPREPARWLVPWSAI